jgi:hypothetical protein
MSGYLQRLAERAVGQSRPLRALAPQRLPGAEVSAQRDELPTPLSSLATQPQAMTHATAAPLPSKVPRQQVAARLDGDTDPAAQAAPRRTVAASTRQPGAQPYAAPFQAHHTAVRADGSGDSATSSRLPPEPLPLMAMQPLHRTMLTLAQPRPTAQNEGERLSGVDETQQDMPAVRTPTPLLPQAERHAPVPSPHLALRTGQEQAAARQPAGAAEEATEVHVTIGRIEVTAVHETPSQKPAARRRPAPLTLDEYIARRQEGRA